MSRESPAAAKRCKPNFCRHEMPAKNNNPAGRSRLDRIARRKLWLAVHFGTLAIAPAGALADATATPANGQAVQITVRDRLFRMRVPWPRSSEEMPNVQVRSGGNWLVLRMPADALGADPLALDLPAGPQSPVRSIATQISNGERQIVLELRQPTAYQMMHIGAAWILELESPQVTAESRASTPAPAPALAPPVAIAPPLAAPPRAGAQSPKPAGGGEILLLDVVINGERMSDVVAAERLADGRLVLPQEAWTETRLRPPAERVALSGGGMGYALEALPGLVYSVDRRRLRLEVKAPAELFGKESLSAQGALAEPPPRPALGALLNYDFSATVPGTGSTSVGGTIEGVLFGNFGSVVGSVLLQDQGTSQRKVNRLDTFWQIDWPNRMETLVVGDAIGTGGAWSRPVRFGGIRYGRDFDLRPGFITTPQLSLGGSAALASTVDVLINNQQRLNRSVQPGPFELTNIPLVSGAGEVNLVVRDLLGRESIVRQSYYSSPRLLELGLSDFSFEAGWLRTGYGSDADTYTDPFGAATWRQGLTVSLTGEGRVELQRERQAAGMELAGLLGLWGVGRVSVAGSRGPDSSGLRLGAGLERSTGNGGASLALEQYSRGFTQFAQVPDETRPHQRLQATWGGRVAGPLSAGVSYTRQTSWNAVPANILGASLSMPLPGRFNASLSYTKDLTGVGGWRAALVLSRPLDDGMYASAMVNRASDGRVSTTAQASKTTPPGPGYGWYVRASDSITPTAYGGVNVNTTFAEMSADLEATRQGDVNTRLGARGSLGLLGGLGFMARPIGLGAFAVVRTGESADVPVLRSHQVVTRTDTRGLALVPGLLPYQANALEIDPSELPLDVDVRQSRIEVMPYARSGVLVDFELRRSRSALVELVQVDGSAVPVGAHVQRVGSDVTFVVAKRGEVYMTDLNTTNALEVSWPGHQCALTLPLPQGQGDLPRIGPLACQPVARP
jgi:outer membrane usher protein